MAARTRSSRLPLPILCLALVCLSLPAWAGHWTVNYSVTPNGGNGFPIGPHFTGSYSQSLTVTATLTWSNVYPGEPPPTTVSYVESSSASANGKTTQTPPVNGLVNPKPVCDDGLGLNDPTVLDKTNNATQCYGTSQGAHLVQKPYSSPLVLPTRTLSAKFTWDSAHSDTGSGSVGLSYSVVVSTASLGGHSTVDTSAVGNPWDPTNPRFFSGTYCHADAFAPALSGSVKQIQLLIGAILTKEYDDSASLPTTKDPNVIYSNGTNQPSASLTTYFDSSHFPDALPISVQMIVTDTAGNKYDSQIKASAFNDGYVGYEPLPNNVNGNFGQATAANVDSALSSCNVGTTDSSPADTRDAVLAAVKVK